MNPTGVVSTRGRFSTRAREALPAPRRSAQTFILALGVLAFAGAHRLAYLLGQAPDEAQAGHGYLHVLELSAGSVAVAALLVFSAAVWRSGAPREELLPFRRPIHLVGICGIAPAAIFVFVEFCERSFEAPPGLPLILGVGLQLLFGCAALLGSRAVLHIVVAVTCATHSSFVSRRTSAGRRPRTRGARPRGVLIRQANPSRAPPAA